MARRWKVLIVTSVAVFMGFLDVTIVNVAFPDLERDFSSASRADLSWVLNAYNIVFAALLVPAGRIADLVGRRRMFFLGLGTFLAASAVAGLAGSLEVLVGARLVQAAGAAILVPTSLGLALPEFPLSMRATATALWTAAGGVAAALGPSLGGVLVDQAGWRWVFFLNLPIGLAAIVPARRLLREIREPGRALLPDVLGTVLLAAGVSGLALGIVEGPDWGWGSTRVAAALVAGAALLALTVRRSMRHPVPVIELSLFRVRSFAVATAGVFVFSAAFYALLLGNILFLTQVWGWSVLTAGFAVTPGPLMATLSAPPGGRLSDRFGQRPVALAGALFFAAGTGWFALSLGATPHYASQYLVGTVLTGVGVGLSYAAWSSAAVSELPAARFSTGTAVTSCLRQVGAVLGIAGLIALLGGATGPGRFTDAYALMSLAAGVAAVLALALGRKAAAAEVTAIAAPGLVPAEEAA